MQAIIASDCGDYGEFYAFENATFEEGIAALDDEKRMPTFIVNASAANRDLLRVIRRSYDPRFKLGKYMAQIPRLIYSPLWIHQSPCCNACDAYCDLPKQMIKPQSIHIWFWYDWELAPAGIHSLDLIKCTHIGESGSYYLYM